MKNTNKIIAIIVAAALSVNGLMAQKMKGSDTVLPLAQKQAEAFMKKNPSARVTVTGGGTGVGILALMDGNTDIAMASRKIKFDERMKLQSAGQSVVEKIIAYDALAVIVNPSNPVSKLTREQLEGIFTGKIKNWKEVGGEDRAIVVYSRETSSGTYEFFKTSVLKEKNYKSSVLSMPATGAIVQSISQTKGAIGYIGLAYLNKQTKAIQVSYDNGKNYVSASYENAKNKKYPIVRPLYLYYVKAKEELIKPFINFALSAEGQKMVDKVGYVDILPQ